MNDSMLAGSNRFASLDAFWFKSLSVSRVAPLRTLLCAITASYFLFAIAFLGEWFSGTSPFAAGQFPAFLTTVGMAGELRWSPLYLVDTLFGASTIAYQLYLLIGVGLCICVALGKGGYPAGWLLWVLFVGWANRLILLLGVGEVLLGLGLFAIAFAPPTNLLKRDGTTGSWNARFALRLLAVQTSLFAAATAASMLSSRVWWNGTGAFALAAPAEDRMFGFGQADSFLAQHAYICDFATHFLVLALPIGFVAAWLRPKSWLGTGLIFAWSILVAVLGSHWMYAATMASSALAIRLSSND